jgi:DNA topoisomerase IB
MPRLRHVDCADPGYRRLRRGRGFGYVDHRGKPIQDAETLERIRGLVIPPAWTDVWICRHPNGHLQAVGVDAAGRRQYLYHPVWRAQRDRQKFDEMLQFARALPKLRRRTAKLLEQDGLAKDRILGFAVTLLDRGLFRIGSEEYAEGNGSYGLTTLERRHVRLEGRGAVLFEYRGKTGKLLSHRIVDAKLRRVAADLKRHRTRRTAFLAFENGNGWTELRAAEINAFIKDVTGGDFSAKDFRTWHATVLAAAFVAISAEKTSGAGRKRTINAAAEVVAGALGNTPAVCKASYIDPRVFDLYRSGETIPPAVARRISATRARERAVLALLEGS